MSTFLVQDLVVLRDAVPAFLRLNEKRKVIFLYATSLRAILRSIMYVDLCEVWFRLVVLHACSSVYLLSDLFPCCSYWWACSISSATCAISGCDIHQEAKDQHICICSCASSSAWLTPVLVDEGVHRQGAAATLYTDYVRSK